MTVTAHLVYDRVYYESNYGDWLGHRSKWQRYAVSMALVIILSGVGMTILLRHQWLVGVVFVMFGSFEFVKAFTHKSRWINARLKTIRGDKTVDIEFNENEMTTTSKEGNSRIRMSAFQEITAASNGVFLIPETGFSIYIPHSAVVPREEWFSLVHSWTNKVEAGGNAENGR